MSFFKFALAVTNHFAYQLSVLVYMSVLVLLQLENSGSHFHKFSSLFLFWLLKLYVYHLAVLLLAGVQGYGRLWSCSEASYVIFSQESSRDRQLHTDWNCWQGWTHSTRLDIYCLVCQINYGWNLLTWRTFCLCWNQTDKFKWFQSINCCDSQILCQQSGPYFFVSAVFCSVFMYGL